MNQELTGWRVCIGRKEADGWLVLPLFDTKNAKSVRIRVGSPLPQAPVHVGTKAQFCLDYYAGCTELADGETELLLELDCTGRLALPDHAERWGWPCATEALAAYPIVKKITEIL